MKKGAELLRDKRNFRSLAFTREERASLGLRGLLPYPVVDQSQMVERVMMSLRKRDDDLDRYMMLSSLQERNERLYYRTILDHIESDKWKELDNAFWTIIPFGPGGRRGSRRAT